jgi:hypothetical protein
MRNRQQGMSYIGFIIIAIMIGFAVKVITLLAPPFLDFHSIDSAVRGSLNELKSANPSVTDVHKAISTQLQVESINLQSQDDILITKDGNVITVVVKYDVTRPFMANIDAVFHFNKTYTSENSSQ